MEDALLWILIYVMMVHLMVYMNIVALSIFAKAMVLYFQRKTLTE